MANQYVKFYTDGNGALQASPDPLYVSHGDNVIWTSGETGDYKVTAFSPAQPPLFSSGSIDLPGNGTSAPATVQANPSPGVPLIYKYSCVPTSQDGKVLDPVIIVEAPGGN